jgi:hypothetical protein
MWLDFLLFYEGSFLTGLTRFSRLTGREFHAETRGTRRRGGKVFVTALDFRLGAF